MFFRFVCVLTTLAFAIPVSAQEHVPSPKPGERRLRLWTLGALRLAAMQAGLSPPERRNGEGLLIMRVAGV